MRSRAVLLSLLVSLCACKPADEGRIKAIVGAVLIDGMGGPPLSDSVVVIAGDRISEAGARSAVAIPADADKIDGSGKFLVPALVNVYPHSPDGASFTAGHPPNPDAARAQVARLAEQRVPAIHVWKMEPAVAQATLEAAREAGIQVIGHVSAQADVRFLVDAGIAGFVGVITDTEDLDPSLLARLRDLRVFFAPSLTTAGAQLPIAERNTHRLFASGVPIALASDGSDTQRELQLLVDSGIPPLDVIVAATRNGAIALRQADQAGTIQAGKRADLLLLAANPGADIANWARVALRLSSGAVR
ncbi:MAG TPA: amidohydrolase family protein [Bryobacteraceae bacterium]|nr:amidohydrolase family protein [Bryobacteraceae bacterium]